MARNAAWFRSKTPVYAFTDTPSLVDQLTIFWGLDPYLIPLSAESPSVNSGAAQTVLTDRGILKDGDWVVIVSDLKIRGEYVETVQMRQVKTDNVS